MRVLEFLRFLGLSALIPAILGALLYLAADLTRDVTFFGNSAELASDLRMKVDADTVALGSRLPPTVLVDFDDDSMERLGFPALLPSAAISTILDQVARSNPSLVILDVDVTQTTDADSSTQLARSVQALGEKGVPVLLLRAPVRYAGLHTPVFRTTSLEAKISALPNAWWVSTEGAPGGDGVERSLDPWTVGCVGNHNVAFPSPALAALLIRMNGDVPAAKRSFESTVGRRSSRCASPLSLSPSMSATFQTRSGKLNLLAPEANRVRYTMAWPPTRSSWPAAASDVPAWAVIRSGSAADLSRFTNAIVIIGASATDRRDFHLTPIGEMPGAFVVANAVRAWLQFGPERTRGFWLGLGLVVALTATSGALVGIAFSRTPQKWHEALGLLLPIFLPTLLWILYFASADPTVAMSVFVIHYLSLLFTPTAHKLVMRLAARWTPTVTKSTI